MEDKKDPISDMDVIEACINLIDGFPEKQNIIEEIVIFFLDNEPAFIREDIVHVLDLIVRRERKNG